MNKHRVLVILGLAVLCYIGVLIGSTIKTEENETTKIQQEQPTGGLELVPIVDIEPINYPREPYGPAQDERVRKIRAFFDKRNEDMVGYSGNFVISADRYGVDPFLLVAVGSLESGHYRYCVDGNCFGHACSVRNCGYTNIKEGIEGGARLFAHERYAGKSIENIGIIYAADQMWSSKVRAIYAELVGK